MPKLEVGQHGVLCRGVLCKLLPEARIPEQPAALRAQQRQHGQQHRVLMANDGVGAKVLNAVDAELEVGSMGCSAATSSASAP